jgi:S1-C subfamily serine protease
VAAFVICGALVLAIGLTILFTIKYKNYRDENDNRTVAQKNESAKPPASSSSLPPKATPSTPAVAPPAKHEEEEEETPVVPAANPNSGRKPAEKTSEPKIPDIGSLLPKLPGPDTGGTKPTESSKPSPSKPNEAEPIPGDSPTRADGQIPAALLAKLKAATVFIKIHAGNLEGSGSGFVLRVDGDEALVVTNRHVAVPHAKGGVARKADLEAVFHSSKKNEFTRKAEVLAADEDHDLAVLRVTGIRGVADFPSPLNTSEKLSLSETMPVYIFGFPFGEMLSTTRGNPAVTIGKGTISSLREDETGDSAFIQIDGDVNPGNSGGPVVDSRGRLVGVTVAKLKGTNIGMAIPPVELTRMLVGRVGNFDFRINRIVRDSTVEIDIRGSLIDPLERVKSASIRVVRADDLKDKPKVGADGKWAALKSSEKTEFKVSGQHVSAQVELPLGRRDRGDFDIWFQPACVDRDGQTHYFAPVTQTLRIKDEPPPGFPGRGPGGPGPGGNPGVPGGPPLPPIPPGFGPMGPGAPGGGTIPRPGAPSVPRRP